MIGSRAGVGGVAFDRVQSIELSLVAFKTTARRERARMPHT
jgi:hypothetical protein